MSFRNSFRLHKVMCPPSSGNELCVSNVESNVKRKAEDDNAHAKKSLRDGLDLILFLPRVYPSSVAPLRLTVSC